MQITIDLDNDTIARLAVGAMKDGSAMDKYIAEAVTELSKLIDDNGDSESIDSLTDRGVDTSTSVDRVIDIPAFAPTAQQGGPGSPLYSQKSTGWKL